jgi:hypothetical protein
MPDLAPWNPWWRDGHVPAALLGTPRALTQEILRLDTARHIKAVVGARRTGKTTILRQVIEHLIGQGVAARAVVLLNFDAPDIQEADFEQLDRTLASQAPAATHLVLDEVQQKPAWERWVRALYDQRRFERIYITGSSADLLAGELGRVLTGRHLTFRGHPFTFAEWWTHRMTGPPQAAPRAERQAALLRFLAEGGFPEAVDAGDAARVPILVDLFHGIVERDVAARHGLDGAAAVRLARGFLRDTGTPYALRRIATAVGVSVERAQRHLDHFIEAGFLLRLDLFSHKRAPGLRRTAKLYSVDAALLSAVVPRTVHEAGRLLETAVANALRALPWPDHAVSYFQDNDGVECDFILSRAGRPTHAIQVAFDVRDASTRDRELRGLQRAARRLRAGQRLLVAVDGVEEGPSEVRADDFLLDPAAFLA